MFVSRQYLRRSVSLSGPTPVFSFLSLLSVILLDVVMKVSTAIHIWQESLSTEALNQVLFSLLLNPSGLRAASMSDLCL